MKTSIKTLIASALSAIVLSTTLLATTASADERKPVKVSTVASFKRISVKGNVEVMLVQRSTTGVSYTEDNSGTAKIMQDGDLLKISSSDKSPVKLVVYVNDIFRIEASDNAVVKTNEKLNAKYLQVFLKGNAKADLNISTEGLYTVIRDEADLRLSGSTDVHTLIMSKTPKLTIDCFAALKTSISSVETDAVEKEVAVLR